MGKWSYAATSLIAAVPAGYLSYLMASVFVKRAEDLETPFQVWVGATLAISALVTVLPIGILIFGRKKAKAEDAEDEGSEKAEATGEEGAALMDEAAEDVEAAEEEEGPEIEDDLAVAEGDESDGEEDTDGEDFGDEMEMDEIDEEDIFAEADDADFDMADFDDDEEK